MADLSQYLAGLESSHGLPEGILNAVMQTESGGRTNAVSPKGAMGPFQFMKATAQQYGVANPFDVKQSAEGAAQFLKDNLSKFGTVRAALAAYNAGPGNVQKAGGFVPNIPETQDYVEKVDARMPQVNPDSVKWDDEKGAAAAPDPSKVQWDDEKASKAPAASPQASEPSMTDKVIRQLGLTARAAGHGIANAAGVIGNPLNQVINSAGRLVGVDPGLRTDLDQVIKRSVDAHTPAPQSGVENAVQDVGAAVANPLSYAIPGGSGATGVVGAAARGIGQGIGATAVNAPVQPGTNPLDYAKQLALGGAAGGVVGAAGAGIGRLMAGANLSPEARAMIDRKVQLTPGQALGGHVGDIENALGGTVPIVGHEIKDAQRAAFSGMNRAVYSEILDPVGGQVPKEVGREAIDSIATQLGDKLDDAYARTSLRADLGFARDMAPVNQTVARMPAQWRDRFNDLLDDNILSRTQQGGTLTGEDVQKAASALSQEAEKLGGDRTPWAKDLLEQVNATQAALRNALLRQNPQTAPELRSLNQAYANYAILRKAAAGVKEDGMPFTPTALSNAVKGKNSTVDKGGYARGQALMQGISDAAQKTMGNTMPNSGTPARQAAMHALGGGGIVGAMMTNPHLLIPPAILTALYGTNIGRQGMLAAIAQRPEVMQQLGNAMVNSGGQIGGILGGGYAAGQQR